VVTEPLRLEDGHVAVPSGSGLGVVVDEEALPTLDAGRA
jgi:L-alanine-DL-glutamate epimerase-like enolase superfamily enzyme